MQKSHKILKKAIDKAGVKKVACEMNLSTALIYKWCQDSGEEDQYPLPSGAANPLDRLYRLFELTGDEQIIQWVCQRADGYFVENPKGDKTKIDARVLRNIQAFIKEFSEALDAISKSYNDGKKITQKEARVIRKEWEDLKRIGEKFVRACEEGRFNK